MAKLTHITYKTSTPRTMKRFARLAIEYNLFQEGWAFRGWLNGVEKGYDTSSVLVLAFDGNFPVGLSILKYYGHVGFYVNPHYRRMGIATKLAEIQRSCAIERLYDFYAGQGTPGSDKFFEWVDIPVDQELT